MTPSAPPSVTVTQADVSAAKAAQVDMLIGGAQGDKEVWRKVEQAFARHRTTAEAASAARVEALVEALADALDALRRASLQLTDEHKMVLKGKAWGAQAIDNAETALAKHQQGEVA